MLPQDPSVTGAAVLPPRPGHCLQMWTLDGARAGAGDPGDDEVVHGREDGLLAGIGLPFALGDDDTDIRAVVDPLSSPPP